MFRVKGLGLFRVCGEGFRLFRVERLGFFFFIFKKLGSGVKGLGL